MSEDPATYAARPPTPQEMAAAEQDGFREASIQKFIEDRFRSREGADEANNRARYEKQLQANRDRELELERAAAWRAHHERQAKLFRSLAEQHEQALRHLIGR